MFQIQIQKYMSSVSNYMVVIPVTHAYAYCKHSESLAALCVQMPVN
jgi:hypothetical protein